MFDKEFVAKLGKRSISRDPALTKERINAAWKAVSKEKQQEVLSLAAVPYSTAYRVRSTGIITVKMTIAFSQVLDLDPYYLIGAVPENAGYSLDSAKKLLTANKYGKAVKEYERNVRIAKAEQAKAEAEAETEAEAAPAEAAADAAVKELTPQAAIQKLNEEDIMTLFRGLIIKAGTGRPQAIADITRITEILLG
ncbi:MAG: hypothetical protein FWF08_08760 [Oscillospiraceae bacterium]|nr:hypothetical protein [Oscillospiraceae bacterium]